MRICPQCKGTKYSGGCPCAYCDGTGQELDVPATSRSAPQPMPPQNTGTAVYDLLYADINSLSSRDPVIPLIQRDFMERDLAGAKKYGTRLGMDDGRDPLLDPYQEAMDLAVYLVKVREIRYRSGDSHHEETSLFWRAVGIVRDLRRLIYERDGR